MLSTVSASFLSPDSMIGNPFASFESGFTPWDDCSQFFENNLDSQYSSTKAAGSTSGSEEPNEPNRSDPTPANSNSSSDQEPNQRTVASVIDERKRRRMISNRESARRSRMRKQKHLENLRNQVNRLRVENREMTNRLRFVLYHWQSVRRENDQLRSEHSMLRQKLSNIRQILMFRQLQQFTSAWPCNNTVTTEQIPPSLIT
ncbi:basic leucine zipper 4 [Ricinus communis]|uniref:Ocs element-binding factor, putative n=1 Tax=Ricinus communis TaxID=3988 RepID=B9T5Q1_RICCO|nr:basic leucine zipper 4 [Ricinus communis]EEF28805.1 Ocs element-binding factor, putative [Ricinus communis]|eukprot:XP_002533570.1 basic leucine zipper 4 [Ricinus communis]